MMQVGPQTRPPVVMVQPPGAATELLLPRKLTIFLGIVQILVGLACIAVNVAAIAKGANQLSYICHGIWGGILFIVTGSICVAAGNSKNKCLVVSTFVLALISAAIAVVAVLVLAALALHRDRYYIANVCDYYYSSPSVCDYFTNKNYKLVLALDSLLIVLAVVEFFATVVSVFLTGRAVCCRRTQTGGTMASGPALMYVNNAQSNVAPPVGFQPTWQPGYQPVAPPDGPHTHHGAG